MKHLSIILLLALPCHNWAADQPIDICFGFGCKHQETMIFDDVLASMLSRLFRPQATNAAKEREQIARAIAYLERHVGQYVGTSADIGGNFDPTRNYPRRFQLDCIDESRNTTAYLAHLNRLGLLRWHRVSTRRHRSRFLVDGHWTAVIEETASGQHYAVDSWYHDNGEPPEIQPLENWLQRKRPTIGNRPHHIDETKPP